MYALQRLHTKLHIFDSKSVITVSANFTFNGFYKNHELGMLMEKEPLFSNECNNYFDGLLNDIKQTGDFEITLKKIEKEKPYFDDAVTGRTFAQKKPIKNESQVIVKSKLRAIDVNTTKVLILIISNTT